MSSSTTSYQRTPQRPVGSGFGRHSTAADVLAGLDLSEVSAVVTGGYSGVGLETTRALSAAGASVVVPARRPDHARDQLAGLPRVEVEELDLADLDSVHGFADRLLASGRPVDVLINNAAVMANSETRVGPGWESQFATNHLGHFCLTNRLWPALASRGARVVSVSSSGHQGSGIRWDDVQLEHGYDKWKAYGQAKTANALFAVELDRLAWPDGVRALSVMPGGIRTPLQRHLDDAEMVRLGWFDAAGNDLYDWKTPEQGAATQLWAATSPRLAGIGGVYCEDVDIAPPAGPDVDGGVSPHASDPEQARRLWALSAELTGVNAFAHAG
ncbi:MAG: Dehydrogenases with different specificities (related to short-chain alcohol dehydrogenases) [uncultured Frankineae bacterium]|uniref:Probable oxidoreductase n=1 Tax=uncultured Frankineae bacterium TaxID=437475 RepID=A0A6J4MGX1_9ACTN|nr:MAG: Dehydrogenases with different specificities (related to short-chain alcohol dehydrogenases) [uncultured Frankineae bacterium]